MSYRSVKQKLLIEQFIMLPFVWVGKLWGMLFPLKTKHRVVLFFPNGDIGGSPQVNIDLTRCVIDLQPLIIFSKYPRNSQFRERYNIEGVRVIDLHRYIDQKLFHFINFFYRGVIASWIKNQPACNCVIGGESLFFYKVIPHLAKTIRRIEICHLDTWLSYSIGYIDDISVRVFSTSKLQQQVEQQYRDNRLGKDYFEKLVFIDNAVDIPSFTPIENEIMQVYFIGRGTAQKRVHLIAAIAKKIHEQSLPVQFHFIGDVERIIDPAQYPYCRFWGNIKDDEMMNKIYCDADVLLMTSLFEGLPLVVMQMMAHGKAVISTAVYGIPDYIFHMENGLLIISTEEQEIVNEGASYIELLVNDPQLRHQLGKRSREIALEKFSRQLFCNSYRKLIQS